MKPIFFLLSIFSATYCLAQSASFKEIRLKTNSKFYTSKEPTIIYPIITTSNSKADSLINLGVKQGQFMSDNKNQTAKSMLMEQINELGLSALYYDVSYNRSGFLSFSIFSEGCGAYCSSSNTYFNFDLTTGKSVSIDDVILKDKIDSFKIMVQKDKINFLTKYKTDEKNILLDNEIDSSTHDWAIMEVDEYCINSTSFNQFSISGHTLEIIDPCEFPHAIRSQAPDYHLKYDYHILEPFLTPRFRKLLQ